MTFKNTLNLIAADTRERCRIENKRYGLIPYLKLVQNPPALVVVIFRFQHWLHTAGWSRTAEILRRFNMVFFTTEISSDVEIGEHFILYHANGISITGRVRIGSNVHIVHHNTIATGPRPGAKPEDRVTIDDNVVIGCGARILGDVSVGHDSFIGAGAVVMDSLPECSFYFGGPGEKMELA